MIDGVHGVWHLAPPDPVTWADLVRSAARQARLDPARVRPCPAAAFGWPAPRPTYSALGTCRGILIPPLADGVARFVRDWEFPFP